MDLAGRVDWIMSKDYCDHWAISLQQFFSSIY